MFDKLKVKLEGANVPTDVLAVDHGKAPTTKQIYQLRENFGVNLGLCFVLEKWIFHELFPENAGSELQAAQELTRQHGKDDARSKFEAFWTLFMSDSDWEWLQAHKVTAIRVPIGYWDIDGGAYTAGTAFEEVKHIYTNAWTIFTEKFVEKARQYNIGVLVDLHGLPFGANCADHSGELSGGGLAKFWEKSKAQRQVCDALAFIARDLRRFENVVGIQIVNEAEFCDDPKSRERYYSAGISAIRKEDPSVPIVLSDGWWPNQWVEWTQKVQGSGCLGVVVDTHCYRCFSADDKQKLPRQIIDDLPRDFLTNLTENGDGVDIMCGEYSCVLDGDSWNKDGAQNQRDELVVEFGQKQLAEFHAKAKAGSYFWTFKFQSGDGGEWDFRKMVEKGAITTVGVMDDGHHIPDQSAKDDRLENAFNDHVAYWQNECKGQDFEHDRFKAGFATAWDDCVSFAQFNGSMIGRVHAWKRARLLEHEQEKGSSQYLWEWNQGFDAGMKAFEQSC